MRRLLLSCALAIAAGCTPHGDEYLACTATGMECPSGWHCGDGGYCEVGEVTVNCGSPTVVTSAFAPDGGAITLCCPAAGESPGCSCVASTDGECSDGGGSSSVTLGDGGCVAVLPADRSAASPSYDNVLCPKGAVCAQSLDAGYYTECVSPGYVIDGGIVTDQRTGLHWEQDIAPNNNPNVNYVWSQTCVSVSSAQYYCEHLNLGGASWRLPTVAELYSLVDQTTSGVIDSDTFPNTPSFPFWTSTPYTATESWVVDFSTGAVYPNQLSNTFSVRCVEGETACVSGNGFPDAG